MRKLQVKQKISLAKFHKGRLKATESTTRGRVNDAIDAFLVRSLSVGQ